MIGLVNHILPCAGARGRKRESLTLDARVRGRLGGSEHERRVATIAPRLFDLLADQHQLDPNYRRLLHLAALVHDAAKPDGADGHEVRGAEMVLADRTLDISPEQRRAVAFLVRYHRGPVPRADRILRRGDGRRKLLVLLALLRAADALDSRRVQPTALIIRRTPRKICVKCLVEGDTADAAQMLGRPRKFKLLEKTFGLRVRVRIESTLPAGH